MSNHHQQQQLLQQQQPPPSRPSSPPPHVYFGIPIVGFFRPSSAYHHNNNSSKRNDDDNERLLLSNDSNNYSARRMHRYSQSLRDVSTTTTTTATATTSTPEAIGRRRRRNPGSNYGSLLQRHQSERMIKSPSFYSNMYQQSQRLSDSDETATMIPPPLLLPLPSSQPEQPNQQNQRRSAQELWDIIRFHVHHETFHIDSNYWHDDVCGIIGGGGGGGTSGDSSNNRNQPPSRESPSLLFTQTPYETHVNFNEMMDLPYDFTIRDCIIALAVYLGISIIAYSYVFERWSIIDSMYFACVSFTTIGYGDLSPSTTGGRFFCIFFALAGVAILAIALGVLGSNIIEHEISAMESTKHKIVDEIISRIPKTIKEKNPKILLHSSSSDNNSNGKNGHHSSFDYLRDFDDPTIHDDYDDYISRSKLKKVQEYCVLFTKLMCRYIPSLLPLFIGSLIIGHNEGWSIIDSIYYCVVTTTTIGYGDRVPQHESMKLFAIVFIPLSVGAMGHFLGTVANFIIDQRRKAYDKQLWKHELTIQDLYCMSSTGVVTELDFVVFMLRAMKKVDTELIDHIRHHFHVLDVTNTNTLCRDDLELIAKRKLRSVKTKLRMSAYRQSITKSISIDTNNNSTSPSPGSVSITPFPSFDEI